MPPHTDTGAPVLPETIREVQNALHEALQPVADADAARVPVVAAPTFDVADLYGPVGDYVRVVAPHTEAAPVSVYVTALALCGALIGRGPSMNFGNTEHHARAFVLLVGPTGAGRKGTALSVGGTRLARLLDEDFSDARIASGLSSAEGLIAEVRDATPSVLDEFSGKVIKHGDPGVLDKRLFVKEGEIGGALEAMAREGNRLSAILRDAWDGVDLRSMVKRDPQRATAPHIAIVGAITKSELCKLLGQASVLNGLANRFLPIWSTRAHLLPRPSEPNAADVAGAVARLRENIATTRALGRVRLSDEAGDRWEGEYRHLAVVDDASPVIRALLERGAPYVLRFAMLFALLDGLAVIEVRHLDAALAVWRYAADSWRFIYADGTARSPLAAKLLAALDSAGAEGLSRSAIRDEVIGSNAVSAAQINAALHELAGSGLARMDKRETAGRPQERWTHSRHIQREPVPLFTVGEKGDMGAKGASAEGFPPFPPFPPGVVRAHLKDGTVMDLPHDSPDLIDFREFFERLEPLPRAA
ncbi:DUF3987 domain-containing protein [Gemmatimonas sp.]|uniref:DUF3987 domain-containing protein n=1 Tax=Gemmatimonas sp. TaxID=1962908 RepID=UPI003DA4E506